MHSNPLSRVLVLTLALAAASPARAETCPQVFDDFYHRAVNLSALARDAVIDQVVGDMEAALRDASPVMCRLILAGALAARSDAADVSPAERRLLRQRAEAEFDKVVGQHLAAGNVNEAVSILEVLAQFQEQGGQYERAASTYARLARIEERNHHRRGEQVRLLLKAGKAEAAMNAAREWVQVAPQDWSAHYALGTCLEAAGQREAALEAYTAAVEHDESSSLPRLARATLLGRMGKWEAAHDAFSRVGGRYRILGEYGRATCRLKLGEATPARELAAVFEAKGEAVLARRLRALLKSPRSTPVLGVHALEER